VLAIFDRWVAAGIIPAGSKGWSVGNFATENAMADAHR
jgi:hypothetical protein